jgi:tetratricopeptide (TPR) repeat protein
MKVTFMSKKAKWIIVAVAAIQVFMIIGVLVWPSIVEALPGSVRFRLQQLPIASDMIEMVTTPIPTMFPTLSGVSSQATGEFSPELDAILNPPTATLPPTSTSAPPAPTAEVVAETATPSPTPSPTLLPTPTQTPTPLPETVFLEGMTAVPQAFNNCGPANLTQVLGFYDSPLTQTEVASYLKPNDEDRNVSPWQIEFYVDNFTTLQATYHSGGDLQLLKRLLAAGFPVVVEKGYLEEACGWCGHYLTVAGYDEAQQEFTVYDSYLGPFNGQGRPESYEELNELWHHFNYTFYVVYRPEQEAQLFDILGPDMVDPIKMFEHAAAIARAEIEANPNDPFAWHNLGTSLVEIAWINGDQEYYQAAAEAYDQALSLENPRLPTRILWYQFGMYKAYIKTGRNEDAIALADAILGETGGRNVEESYYYRAWALINLNRVSEAVTDLETALERNPNFSPARLMLDSL